MQISMDGLTLLGLRSLRLFIADGRTQGRESKTHLGCLLLLDEVGYEVSLQPEKMRWLE